MYAFGGQQKAFTLTQNADGLNSTATLISGLTAQKTYDTLNRETIYAIGASLKRQLTYENVSGNRTTSIPSAVSYQFGGSNLLNVNYTYDAVGNIATMVQDGVTYTYTYDALNQLTAVATSDNSYTATFSYDNGGNLTSKTVNGQTYTYSYGDTEWKDLLTAYNGESITYDQIGNPLSYRGKTLTWTGRRLDTLTQNGSTNTYLYNADGIRTQKTVNGTATEYFLNGSAILAEKTGDTVNWFIYDDSGDVLGLIHNGTAYYYLKNQQGDVLKIVDGSGNVVGSYTYDAWGKVLSATGEIAQANPIRYRSYYYDAETGLYYLQSRYYDPEIGRFISADDTQYLGASGTALGYNLFGYCENNPVNAADPSGEYAITFIFLGVILLSITMIFSIAVNAVITSPGFQNGLNRLIESIRARLIQKWNQIAMYATFLFYLAKNAVKNWNRKPYEFHHIVPQSRISWSWKANSVRSTYESVGYGIQDARNITILKSVFHRKLNSHVYYNFLYAVFDACCGGTRNATERKYGVNAALGIMRYVLRVINNAI